MSDKAPGRGVGKFAVAGHEASQEERLGALEDYLADLIESGTLPEPVVEEDAETPA